MGSGPAKPAMSKPQKAMPLHAAESPAVSALRNSLFTDCWSPAQSRGVLCCPAKPARLKSACSGPSTEA